MDPTLKDHSTSIGYQADPARAKPTTIKFGKMEVQRYASIIDREGCGESAQTYLKWERHLLHVALVFVALQFLCRLLSCRQCKETGNISFCPSQEKLHTVVLRDVRNICEAP